MSPYVHKKNPDQPNTTTSANGSGGALEGDGYGVGYPISCDKANNMDETSWIEWRDPATMKCHTVCFGEMVDYPCPLKVGEIEKGQACVHLVVTCRAIPFLKRKRLQEYLDSMENTLICLVHDLVRQPFHLFLVI
jgi:hypothetical protein